MPPPKPPNDGSFSAIQLAQIKMVVHEVMSERFSDVGLRVDEIGHEDEAREDFRFLRRMRKNMDGFAAKVGWFIIAALLGGVVYIVNLGLNTWRGGG